MLVVTFAYEVPQNVRWGQTLGKRAWASACGRATSTASASPGHREHPLGRRGRRRRLVGGVFTLVDYLWPLGQAVAQTIHDKAAKTTSCRTVGSPDDIG
jgi:hypothetical protein